MNNSIVIRPSDEKPIPAAELRKLYDSEPWWPERSEEDLAHVLSNYPAVGAWNGEELIGFVRAVTDGRLRAYIEDMLVLKAYRHHGIGRELLSRLLADLPDIHVITLFCRPRLADFYEGLGFKHFDKQIVMHLRQIR